MNVGIDPGKLGGPKLLFCTQLAAGEWILTTLPPVGVFEVAAVEGQIPNKAWARQGLMTLAGGAMAALWSVEAVWRIVLPPSVWKGKLIDNGGLLPKAACCRNLVQLLRLPADLDPEDDADQDVIDSCGIHAAISKLSGKEIKKYAVAFLPSEPRLILQRPAGRGVR